MLLPGRTYSIGSGYWYGFNGQEHSDDVTKGNYTAQFWEYDSRIGRRWNLDPKPLGGVSKYSVFGGNPIWYGDPRGDTTFVFNEYGKYLRTIPDGLPNEAHFVKHLPLLANFKGDAISKQIRSESIAFIGPNTIKEARNLETKANKDHHEIFFLGKMDENKEIRLTELVLPQKAYNGNNEVAIGTYIDGVASDKVQKESFLIGHTHQSSITKGAIADPTQPTPEGRNFYTREDNGSGDYGPILNRNVTKYGYIPGTYDQGNYTVTEKGKTAALIITNNSITIYGTGSNYSSAVGTAATGAYGSVTNKTTPEKQSTINYSSIQ